MKNQHVCFDFGKIEDVGVSAIIIRHNKDGMMLGPDIITKKLLECISIPIITSGGVFNF